ncbi:uncharacterized protein FOMMEDRAFT_18190 [Fomitiporia mediterranea MF3/22]|uniref:uncharacterized protein n=1 Tax=Fomitiporia mediterranea (strain MF3/22) TaxID=694068 RepID=UPI00044077CD|nr:uncharacterized protein FOMMEDRAFT_18190 [Fomitiporia mediterranea MF3/22]EJD05964.1 hypothetical protein FOMMEDRAFT_18190 [Fomitiporia mediterranea MF3/22]
MPKTTSSTKRGSAAKKVTKPSAHPSWVDMIKECIVAHPEDARMGVSRPTIKKFIESKYKITMDAFHTSQLSRAIVSGSEKGTFVLPKGRSGKVKLAPKAKADAIKEIHKAEKENKKAPKVKITAPKKAAAPKKTLTTKEVGEWLHYMIR